MKGSSFFQAAWNGTARQRRWRLARWRLDSSMKPVVRTMGMSTVYSGFRVDGTIPNVGGSYETPI